MIDAILVYSPEKELEVLAKFAQDGNIVDWKPAIILSAAYLEKFGVEKLKRHFEKKKIKIIEKLEGLSLPEVSLFLYGLGLIEEKRYTHMSQIWRERIKIVHQKGILPAYVGEEANKKYGKMIKHALEIIGNLKKKE
jgi:hypothetical protein